MIRVPPPVLVRCFVWMTLAAVEGCRSTSTAGPASAVDFRGAADSAGTPAELPPRRPDGVVMEPPPALATATEHGEARGVVVLRQPLGSDSIASVVEDLIEAWRRESPEALGELLTPDAGPIEGRSRGRAALVEGFRQRMRAHEYGRLAGVSLVRPENIARYDWDNLSAPGAPPRPPEMRPEEVYVRIPLEMTRVAGERLFGDVIVLLLGRDGRRYRIAAYGEVDAR